MLTIASIRLVLDFAPLHGLGVGIRLGPTEIVGLLAAVLPVAPLFAAFQMAVATLVRSYKEAQTYTSFLIFAAMVPTILTLGEPVEQAVWKLAAPALGQHILINGIIRGAAFAPSSYLSAALASGIGAVALLLLTARLFEREAIVFGR